MKCVITVESTEEGLKVSFNSIEHITGETEVEIMDKLTTIFYGLTEYIKMLGNRYIEKEVNSE